jgi:microsomal epoxide hydrolase
MPEPSTGNIQLDKEDQKAVVRAKEFLRTGSGYSLEHATRPSTIGMVLASNPLALLAW